jgi:hypothetical protein
MVKLTLLALLIVFVANVLSAADGFDESNYFISKSATSITIAESECKQTLGADATLVAIESLEKWNFLKDILESYGSGSYWTDGIFDSGTNAWRWASSNQSLPAFAPWGLGYPASKSNHVVSVILAYYNRHFASWRTSANNEVYRYICEKH